MVVAWQILLLGLLSFTLIKATETVILSVKHLARSLGVSNFGITAFVLALATSLPELVVGVVASWEGEPSIVLGNVLGSNIADISLIIGGAAVAGGQIRVKGEIVRKDLILVFGAACLPVLLIEDLVISRSDGLILLIVYAVFVATVLRKHTKEIGKHAFAKKPLQRLLISLTRKNGRVDIARFVVGVGLLLASSHLIVQMGKAVAGGLGVPVLVIGLILIAVGTSLPELVFEMKAVLAGEVQMAIGDLLGSVVANATLILGLSALISPIRLHSGLSPYLSAITAFVIIYLMFYFFIRSKGKLSRWEGILLILTYFGFVVFELGQAIKV